MKTHYLKTTLGALCLGLSSVVFSQSGNISINLAGAASTKPAILDLSDASNAHLGFLMPNVSLASATDATTIPGPTDGMIVWNTNSGMPFGVGYYYWSNSTSQWYYMYNSGNVSAAVTSVGLADGSATPIYSITNSPVTSTGTLTFTLNTEAANMIFAGPSIGSAAQPGFRSMVNADFPTSGVTAGTYNNVTVNAQGITTGGSNVSYLTANQTITLSGAVAGSGTTAITTTYSGNLPVAKLNSGTGASGTTFWRGDGSWATPSTVATSVPFSGITTGVNNSASMTVGNGATLTYSGTGNINATSIETFIASVGGATYPLFVANNFAGSQAAALSSSFTYNVNTQTLSATNFTGTSATLGKASQAGVLVVGDAEATPKTATIQAPATITATYTINLPTTAAGSTGMVLGVPTATGQLGWITPNAGTVTGSGTATQVAFWSGSSALSSNSNLYWDNTNSRLGIKNSTPLVTLDVSGTIHMTGEASPNVTTQGGYLSWNTLCCNGEMDFINNKGGGSSGGFMFFNSTNLTAPLLSINSSGAIMPNNTAGTAGQVLTTAGPGGPPTWTTPAGGITGLAQPAHLVEMTAVTGSAVTAMYSDAVLAIDPAIAPTWTGLHTFTAGITSTGTTAINLSADASATTVNLGTGAGVKAVSLGSTNTTSNTIVQSGSGGVNINASNNQPTNINTGTSSGTVAIGGGSGNPAVTVNNGGTGTTTIDNAGTGKVVIGNSTGLTGVNEATPASTLDVNGSIAGRASAVTLSASGALTVGNTSHIMITSTGAGATATTPWTFTLPAGQAGQYLTIEQVAGYSTIVKGSANVQITSTAFFLPYSTMTLKYDGSYWVELTRNASVLSFTPVTLSGSPPTTYNGKQVFTYTGGNQTFNVPSYAAQVYVKMWGAGGGGGYYGEGGAGAYVGGYFNVSAGSTFTVVVGGGGQGDAASAIGGFAGGGPSGTNTSGVYYGGAGGGRAAIQTTSGTDVITAGGGAGGGGYLYTNPPGGGGGGATTGATGTTSATAGASGGGATIAAGGAAGTGNAGTGTAGGIGNIWQGGTGAGGYYGGGGGGGGYYGGGGAGSGTNSTAGEKGNAGGGGGSSYTANLVAGFINTAGGNSGTECTQSTAPNNADGDYISSGTAVGTGGWSPACQTTENGGPGEVVIYW